MLPLTSRFAPAIRRSLPAAEPGSRVRRSRSRRLAVLLASAAFVVSACTSGPGNRDDLVAALTADDAFSAEDAGCIADKVFAEYGEDGDALSKISGLGSFEELTGTEGVPGFEEFFENAINQCTF